MPRRAKPRTKNFEILIQDHGNYWQVYHHSDVSEVKLGNIYPPGCELFGEIIHPTKYVADSGVFKRRFLNFQKALFFLLRDIHD